MFVVDGVRLRGFVSNDTAMVVVWWCRGSVRRKEVGRQAPRKYFFFFTVVSGSRHSPVQTSVTEALTKHLRGALQRLRLIQSEWEGRASEYEDKGCAVREKKKEGSRVRPANALQLHHIDITCTCTERCWAGVQRLGQRP